MIKTGFNFTYKLITGLYCTFGCGTFTTKHDVDRELRPKNLSFDLFSACQLRKFSKKQQVINPVFCENVSVETSAVIPQYGLRSWVSDSRLCKATKSKYCVFQEGR